MEYGFIRERKSFLFFFRYSNHFFNISGQWEIVPGSGPGMTLGPDEAEWRWNSLTQNWERTVVTGNSGASGGNKIFRMF